MFDNTSIVIMYAVTPCHAGSGAALGVVDLPIQRERHTNYPVIQASGVKGAFRANFDIFKNKISDRNNIVEFDKLTDSIFGTDKGGNDGSGYAGSLSVGDARILAFPMRSNAAPFVWITCPAVLKRFQRDLEVAGKQTKVLNFDCINSSEKSLCLRDNLQDKILLEDFEVEVLKQPPVPQNLLNLVDYFPKPVDKLLLVSDEVFNYGVSDCTQVIAQIKIDEKTGTTKEGSLHYQEELPSDTVMYSVIHWGDSKNTSEDKLKADTIKDFITNNVISKHVQIGGDETLGRGIFSLEWK